MNPNPKRPAPDKQVNVTPPLPGEKQRVTVEYSDGRVTMQYNEKDGQGDCTRPAKPRISWL
jgi:hypothetical protein